MNKQYVTTLTLFLALLITGIAQAQTPQTKSQVSASAGAPKDSLTDSEISRKRETYARNLVFIKISQFQVQLKILRDDLEQELITTEIARTRLNQYRNEMTFHLPDHEKYINLEKEDSVNFFNIYSIAREISIFVTDYLYDESISLWAIDWNIRELVNTYKKTVAKRSPGFWGFFTNLQYAIDPREAQSHFLVSDAVRATYGEAVEQALKQTEGSNQAKTLDGNGSERGRHTHSIQDIFHPGALAAENGSERGN